MDDPEGRRKGTGVRTFVIGRSPFADILIVDATVASHHAELVITEDGRLYLTDCASPGGTWRRSADGETWTPLRQEFIHPDDPLRFGSHVAVASDLLKTARPATETADIARPVGDDDPRAPASGDAVASVSSRRRP